PEGRFGRGGFFLAASGRFANRPYKIPCLRRRFITVERGQALTQGRRFSLSGLYARADRLLGVLVLFILPKIVVQITLGTLGRVQRQDEIGQRGIEVVGD